MGFTKRYIEYLKDNPEGYWFKRKLFGWGWTPARPQGWVVTIGYIIILVALAFTIDEDATGSEVAFMLILPFLILTTLLVIIASKKGEPARWQWGFPKTDSNGDISEAAEETDTEVPPTAR